METIKIVTIVVFLITLFLFYKATIKKSMEESSERMWKLWGDRTYYWQAAVIISGGITFVIMFFLVQANIVAY